MQAATETYIFPNNDLPKSSTQRISDTITVTGTVKEEKRNGTSGQTLNTGTSVGSPVTLHHPVGKQQYSPPFYIPGNGRSG